MKQFEDGFVIFICYRINKRFCFWVQFFIFYIFIRNEDFFIWFGFVCVLVFVKFCLFFRQKFNVYKIKDKFDYGDLYKLEDVFINF